MQVNIESFMDTGIKRKVLEEIILYARKNNIDKVILFGSRARGDYSRTSDIDIAVSGGNISRFVLDINEETSTLLGFDIVDLESEIQCELRESIKNEGRVIYEKI